MSDAAEDVRQNRVLWWLMLTFFGVGFIALMMVWTFFAVGSLNLFADIPTAWRMAIVWGGGWALVLSIGAVLVVPWLWRRFITQRQLESERQRYRAMSRNEDTLPASAWADDE